MENIIEINLLELASELAHRDLEKNSDDQTSIFKDPNADVLEYTDQAQDLFNELYDQYTELILNCKA